MAGEQNGREHGRLVRVPAGPVFLEGNLAIPGGALGIVLFAHGSGSSRFSPRNRAVARALRGEGLATMLIDLSRQRRSPKTIGRRVCDSISIFSPSG